MNNQVNNIDSNIHNNMKNNMNNTMSNNANSNMNNNINYMPSKGKDRVTMYFCACLAHTQKHWGLGFRV